MKVIAWKNGKHARKGTSYGLSVKLHDRDRYLSRTWKDIIVHLPNGQEVVINIDKPSFWNDCPHLIDARFTDWFYEKGLAPWPNRQPPCFNLFHRNTNVFDLYEK